MNRSADTTIKLLYEAIDRRDVAGAMEFIDDDCIYEDLNFPAPFTGKQAVRQLFAKSCENIPKDLLFVIDDLTTTDPLAVGVVWHVELDGIPLPNGRGVSFYRFSPTSGKLIFARDIVEPPIKPGNISFLIIRLISPLVRRFCKKQPEKRTQPLIALFLLLLAGSYIYILLLSPPGQIVPGYPAWAIQPDILKEILDESINFFFILAIANAVGIKLMVAPTVHPASQAFFNFAEAWIFIFLPLLLADRRGDNLPKVPIWGMAMFLTNAVLTPYMALRSTQPIPEQVEETNKKTLLARVFGWIGLIVGITAIWWFCFAGGSEFGTLTERMQYFLTKFNSDRVTLAFSVDLILFYIFQIILMGSVLNKRRWLRFIPFWGPIAWLIS